MYRSPHVYLKTFHLIQSRRRKKVNLCNENLFILQLCMLTSSEEIAQPCVSLKINDKRELKEMCAILLS